LNMELCAVCYKSTLTRLHSHTVRLFYRYASFRYK